MKTKNRRKSQNVVDRRAEGPDKGAFGNVRDAAIGDGTLFLQTLGHLIFGTPELVLQGTQPQFPAMDKLAEDGRLRDAMRELIATGPANQTAPTPSALDSLKDEIQKKFGNRN